MEIEYESKEMKAEEIEMNVTWKCEKCGHPNPYDKETADKAMAIAKESLKAVPMALLFGALKALGWLFLGIAALKYVGVI